MERMPRFVGRAPWLLLGGLVVLLLGSIGGFAVVQADPGAFGARTTTQTTTQTTMPGGGMAGQFTNATPVTGTTLVVMTNTDRFSPAVLSVPLGATVTWSNRDTDAHTVTFMGNGFGMGNRGMMGSGANTVMSAGATYQLTFTAGGVYHYRCQYHQGMVGEIIVSG